MYKTTCFTILLSVLLVIANAQPGSTRKPVPIDPFCDSIQLILKNAQDGYRSYRYNELQGSVSLSYSTTLPGLGFQKKYVQTGKVNPYRQQTSAALPFYIATTSFKTIEDARVFYYSIKNKVKTCVKPVGQDSATKTGFDRNTSFQVSKPVKDSFITIELLLLADPSTNLVALRIFHNQANMAKGNMPNPPVAVNKHHYPAVLPLLKALLDYSPNNFIAIRKDLLQNQKWKPTYTSIVSYNDFVLPKIEYVTHNLWNQYSTNLYFKNEADAQRRFDALVAEIEKCKTTLTYQRYDSQYNKPRDLWWYYERGLQDADGKKFKNILHLTLTKFEYGEGYYITFEFRKSVG